MADDIRISVEDVARHFEGLEDPRSDSNQRHPLGSVVVIGLMAVLLPLPNGIPPKDVYRRVLSALKPDAFQACFASWLQSLRANAEAASGGEPPVLAVDGKTLRRSHDRRKGLGALHSVSIGATEFGLTLGQVATDETSNEITAIPERLRLVDVQGAIMTIDAMGTPNAIAKQIVDADADDVLALKGNQDTMHQEVTS